MEKMRHLWFEQAAFASHILSFINLNMKLNLRLIRICLFLLIGQKYVHAGLIKQMLTTAVYFTIYYLKHKYKHALQIIYNSACCCYLSKILL